MRTRPVAVTVPVAVAAAASAAAGLVHAAAVGAHADDRGLAVAFAVTAVLQLAWAGLLWQRGATRAVVLPGVLLQLAALATWAASRNTGISWFPGLEHVETISVQDTSVVAFEVLAAFAGLAALLSPPIAATKVSGVVAAGVVALALPGMVFPHSHDRHIELLDAGIASATHQHGEAHARDGRDAPDGGLPEVPGVTAAQRARAAKLIADTERSLVRFRTVAAAEAAGYRSIGDAITGFEHFVNASYLANPTVVDPHEPESLVFEVEPDGARTLASAMYILPPGKTMADVPDIAGAMTQWHDHQNLCWDASGTRLAGILGNGRCTPGGTFRATPPMLHVWVVPNECGPFAGIEGSAHTGSCLHAHAG